MVVGMSQKPCDVSNLMSPPEPEPLDNLLFEPILADGRHQPPPPPSPPISPLINACEDDDAALPTDRDPILSFEEDGVTDSSSPLFRPAGVGDSTTIIDQHIGTRPTGYFRGTSPPKREDYELVLWMKSNAWGRVWRNPRASLLREKELRRALHKTVSTDRLPNRAPKLRPLGRPSPLSMPRESNHAIRRVPKPLAAPRKNRTASAHRSTPAPRSAVRGGAASTSTSELRKANAAPSREDKDFRSLLDYSPPLESLPDRPNCLKVDWKGAPLDLGSDPYASLLHPHELNLAGTLRLDCATYLTSKRRIFQRRLECVRIGKEFRKTDAQQACKIDVNKASKIWTAFDRVGWLKAEWMAPYM